MVPFDVPADITVDDFFRNHVPAKFREVMAAADPAGLVGKEFSLQFDVEGRKHCLKVRGADTLDHIEGGIDAPMLTLGIPRAHWGEAVAGMGQGVIDRFIDPTQIADTRRYKKLLKTKGTLHVELDKPGGGLFPLTLVFNGGTQPSVTIRLAVEDWIAMQNKEANGQVLFMTGKMKTKGDMMFLMSLQALL